MMRVVIDTNVLLSALISPVGAPNLIYQAWRAHKFQLITSSAQLDELRRVSHYPKLRAVLRPHQVGRMVKYLRRAPLLERLPPVTGIADPDDAFLLAMALAGNADFLVTGDRRAGLLQQGHFGRTKILLPAAFCAEVL